MADQQGSALIHIEKETYGETFGKDLLEQYKLYVHSAEKVSARRVASSRYLLAVNAALIALYGFHSAGFGQNLWTLLIPFIGLPVSLLWRSIITSYADLNRVKFDIVHEFERHLPAAMYKYEWRLAEEGKGKAYRTVTSIERRIPVLFAVLHGVLAVIIILEIAGLRRRAQ